MLFKKHTLGNIELQNRIVMPPMTRSRAAKGEVATSLMAEYYEQRSSAGLIISEGTQISQQGQGYAWTPGIYTPEQVAGWKQITDAVHRKNGIIFAQLWHVGRVSHTALQKNNEAPVSSSELVADGVKVFVDLENLGPENGVGEMVQHSKPRALNQAEIKKIVSDYVKAAQNAMAAGFDGIELHAANGYLINQFIDSQANNRTDEYGGTLENRLRFLKEVVQAISDAIGSEKVGVRLAPLTTLQGTIDDNPLETYTEAIKLLERLKVTYVHIAEADWDDAPVMERSFKDSIRAIFSGTLIYSGKYTKTRAEEALDQGWADLIGFGRPFIANPDLPYRLEHDLPLNEPRRDYFFGGGVTGYTDYPFYPITTNTIK